MNGTRGKILGGCFGLALLSLGCGKEAPPAVVPTKGVVLLAGAPLSNAAVRFIPQAKLGPQYIATGVTDAEGRFTLKCNGQDGAAAVENAVIVAEADIPPKLQGENAQRELAVYLRSLKNRPIPQNYGSPATSPLRITPSAEKPDHKLELNR